MESNQQVFILFFSLFLCQNFSQFIKNFKKSLQQIIVHLSSLSIWIGSWHSEWNKIQLKGRGLANLFLLVSADDEESIFFIFFVQISKNELKNFKNRPKGMFWIRIQRCYRTEANQLLTKVSKLWLNWFLLSKNFENIVNPLNLFAISWVFCFL